MLPSGKQLTAFFHEELYKLISKDHLLCKINEAVDFSLIHELVKIHTVYSQPHPSFASLKTLIYKVYFCFITDEKNAVVQLHKSHFLTRIEEPVVISMNSLR